MTVADPLPETRVLATAEELADVHELTELRRLRDIAYALEDGDALTLLQAACDLADGRVLLGAIRADAVREKREAIRLDREARTTNRIEVLTPQEAEPRPDVAEQEGGPALAPFGVGARSDDLGE